MIVDGYSEECASISLDLKTSLEIEIHIIAVKVIYFLRTSNIFDRARVSNYTRK